MIDFNELNGEKRSNTMALLHQACEKWGFFKVKKISAFVFYTIRLTEYLIYLSF